MAGSLRQTLSQSMVLGLGFAAGAIVAGYIATILAPHVPTTFRGRTYYHRAYQALAEEEVPDNVKSKDAVIGIEGSPNEQSGTLTNTTFPFL